MSAPQFHGQHGHGYRIDVDISELDIPTPAELGRETGYNVLGTCRALTEDENDMLYNADGFAEALDEVAMECECCGWWVEPHELDDNMQCEDCRVDQVPGYY